MKVWSGAQSDEIADGKPTWLVRMQDNPELRIVAYVAGNEHDDGNVKLGTNVFRTVTQGPVLGRQLHSGWGIKT